MNAHSMNRFGIIFVGTLGIFLVTALSTLVLPNLDVGNIEANYKTDNVRIVQDDRGDRLARVNSQKSAIE